MGRIIRTDKYEPIRQAMNSKMESQQAKEIYARRKVIAEPPFGHIKNSGFRGFSLRGKEKVAGEFSLVCTAYNFKKIVKAVLMGLVRPKGVKEHNMPRKGPKMTLFYEIHKKQRQKWSIFSQ